MSYSIPRKLVLFAALVLGCGMPTLTRAQYSPEHPKVREMVDRGVQFLSGPIKEVTAAGYDDGSAILIAYTIFKVVGDTEHPKVSAGIGNAIKVCNQLPTYRGEGESKVIYEAAVAGVLLASIDGVKYRPQLSNVIDFFQRVQKPHGGFGYPGKVTGDTSQVQYVMLSLWTLSQVDMEIPVPMVEGTIKYLRSTMDPTGSWGYQGKLSNGLQLVRQDAPNKSLGTAGIGALLIGSDILGLFGARKKQGEKDDGIPDAFRRIDLIAKMRAERRELTITREFVDGPLGLATRYQNTSEFTSPHWYFYWRYSQERYESFREIVEGRQEKSPAWYNEGVNDLAAVQSDDGAWGRAPRDSFLSSPDIDTAFAILFLIRSTQKAIGKLDEGTAYGGYTLPTDVSKIKMVGDKIVSDAETSVESLLSMMENDGSRVQIGLLPDELQLTADPVQRKEQVARLSRLLSSRDYSARRIAAKLLGRSEDLEQVPDLIYALSDEDPRVPMIAEESLRLLSRKLKSGRLGEEPTPAERAAAVKYWKDWYLGLRPDYIFVDRR